MLVGEIGIDRREFLYELKLWEIFLITRGYFRRYHPGWEQARLIAYNAAHCMGAKNPPTITQWLKFPWERDHAEEISDDEVNEIRKQIESENQAKASEQK
jgi:hypothetical protein